MCDLPIAHANMLLWMVTVAKPVPLHAALRAVPSPVNN